MKKYDVFISYRRSGGYDTAKHLNDLLVRDGYKVSFDIDTLRNGNFDEQLYQRIDECIDFILIVDEHAFDRTLNPSFPRENDWLRCELAYALSKDKNIIPVFLSGITEFPDGLPEDIIGVKKKNGPEYNRYYFNDFYRGLKKRYLQSRSSHIGKTVIAILALCVLIAGICFFLLDRIGGRPEPVPDDIVVDTTSVDTLQHAETQPEEKNPESERNEALKKFSGSFSIISPGAMKDGITYVYNMELDPIGSNCEWVEDGVVNISNSLGYCGTIMQFPEIWEIYNFSLHNSLKYAIADMRIVDDFHEGESKLCQLKLELDEFDNLKMSFVSGNYAPSPLVDDHGKYSKVATFYRQ